MCCVFVLFCPGVLSFTMVRKLSFRTTLFFPFCVLCSFGMYTSVADPSCLREAVCLELGVFLAQAIRRKLASIYQLLLCSYMVMSACFRQWVLMSWSALWQFLGGTKSVVREHDQDWSRNWTWWSAGESHLRGGDGEDSTPILMGSPLPSISTFKAAGFCLQGFCCQCFSYNKTFCCLTLSMWKFMIITSSTLIIQKK